MIFAVNKNGHKESHQEWLERRKASNPLARTWVFGQDLVAADVPRSEAAQMYRDNWDGCRILWKSGYR
jgi:hypothetical protein